MKYIYLGFILLITSITGFAQSIQLIYNGSVITNGSEINLSTIDPDLGQMKAEISVKNIDPANISVKVKKTEISIIPESVNSFCWGVNCYSPSTNISTNAVSIPSNSINNSFYAEYLPAGASAGKTSVKYEFFNTSNTSDLTSVIVNYIEGNVSKTDELSREETIRIKNLNGLTNISFNITSDTRLFIYDLSGQIISDCILIAGVQNINLPIQLKKGIYIYSLYNADRFINSAKFIIQ